jgi:hypothetical protein
MDASTVADWYARINNLYMEYEIQNVFNCDETGLYWRGLPSRSLTSPTDDNKKRTSSILLLIQEMMKRSKMI